MTAVDYSFYAQTFKGKVSDDDFDRLSVKAAAYLDRVSFQRITEELPETILQKVRLAFCELVDAFSLEEQGGGVTAESNDGISVTYASAKSTRTEEQKRLGAVSLYLAGTGLLYRGVD